MNADHLTGIEKFEADLWKVADNLRANSNLASNEYFMPILGLIFLRHATNRYHTALAAIEEDKATGKMPDRPLVEADFTHRRALMLPAAARYDRAAADAEGWQPWLSHHHSHGSHGRSLSSARRTVAEGLRTL